MNNIEKINKNTDIILDKLKKLEEEQKFSKFAREKFNEVGLCGKKTKAEHFLDELYDIATGEVEKIDEETGERSVFKKAKAEERIKAIKVFAEMVGGGLNERTVINNTQNNVTFNDFLNNLKD